MTPTPQTQNPAGRRGQAHSEYIEPRQAITARQSPKPDTIRARILAALQAGRSLTSLDVWREFGGSRLAADVHALRRMGWPIVDTETAVACREGRSARVASYRLDTARGAA